MRGESFFEALVLRRNAGKDTYYFIRHHPSNNTFLIAQSFRDGATNEFSVLGWTLSRTKTYKPASRDETNEEEDREDLHKEALGDYLCICCFVLNLTDGGEVRGESFLEAVVLRRNAGKDTSLYVIIHLTTHF